MCVSKMLIFLFDCVGGALLAVFVVDVVFVVDIVFVVVVLIVVRFSYSD